MGQPIEVVAQVLGDVALFDADRSITGQDGVGFSSQEEAASGDEFGAALAVRIFDADDDVDHVFVASNGVSVRRRGGWDDASLETVSRVIRRFFVFYEETPA